MSESDINNYFAKCSALIESMIKRLGEKKLNRLNWGGFDMFDVFTLGYTTPKIIKREPPSPPLDFRDVKIFQEIS